MHRHEHSVSPVQKPLYLALILTGLTFAAEVAGGLWTHSVALLSDAGHVFMDLAALGFSLFALKLAQRPASDRRTYGLHRLEVFAAFLNGALVTGVAVWIVMESIDRLRHQSPGLKVGPMLAVAVLGLAVNLLVAWQLHDFAKKDVNLRGAFLHVTSDIVASLGVVIGGVLIKLTGRAAIDPIVGLCVACIIVVNALRLLKDSIQILLEGVPKDIDLPEVISAVRSVPGVTAVEDTHVWNICSHISSFSAHVSVAPTQMADQRLVLDSINALLHERFHIAHTTIQIHSSDWKKN
jgi:cobalt-zinc-cadmium efflux system protein